MKTAFSLLFVVLITSTLTSCTNYQYLTVSGDEKIDESARFTQILDSIEVTFSFTPDAMMNIQIENGKSQLMYVDWEKSSFIYNKESIPMVSNEAYFTGSAYSFGNYPGVDFDGTLYQNQNHRFLPPDTYIIEQFPLNFIQFLNNDELMTVDHIKDSFGKLYQYNEDNSPFKFQTFIYLNDQSEKNPIILQHTFWIKEVYNTTDGNRTSYANQMKLSQINKAGATLGTMTLIGVTLYLAATLAPEEETNTNLLGQ